MGSQRGAVSEPLLPDAFPRAACSGAKTLIQLSILIGVSFVLTVLVCMHPGSAYNSAVQEPSIMFSSLLSGFPRGMRANMLTRRQMAAAKSRLSRPLEISYSWKAVAASAHRESPAPMDFKESPMSSEQDDQDRNSTREISEPPDLPLIDLWLNAAKGLNQQQVTTMRRQLVRSGTGREESYEDNYKDPITKMFDKLLPGKQQVEQDPLADLDWNAPKATGLSTKEMAVRLDAGLREHEWFVTGRALPELFSDDFFFSDPQVTLVGIEKYCRGVRRLFDQESARAEIVCVAATSADTVTVVWRNSGKVNLGPGGFELKPYVVTTTLQTSADKGGLVVKQEDKFDLNPIELFAYALLPFLRSSLPPPAAPVEELSKLYDPETCMPKRQT
eukprot:gnl/TRDRNA2_/TRDRNA2_29787_c0_seq1.p1 gnl/TRDRNA2_/TRDRNA2_29787_c0~~gnl/TRDRNA2_/TRDRNA2_29787_c0_seq1.p1  ORF type:complete len:403 (+),score=48.31 gnl/TRDRNA2_/TRDRNA2_29787_c0_seq1:46-1209(+)